jgi:hypothetical protein
MTFWRVRDHASRLPTMAVLRHDKVLAAEERALEIEQREREFVEQTRELYDRYSLEYFGWLLIGLFLLFWSFHTTDSRYAGLCLWGGIGIGDAGMLWTLVRGNREAEERGL